MSQKKAKFNIIDVLVILVLIVGIAFVGMRMFGGDDSTTSTSDPSAETFYVTFVAESVPEAVSLHLETGLKAENNSRNMDLGTVYDFTVSESRNYIALESGEYAVASKPGYVQITLTCELTGVQQGTGLLVGEFMLNVGHYMTVRAGNTEMYCYVADIQAAQAAE